MDRLLSASKELSDKIDSNESAANELLHQCEVLQQNVKAMIQVSNIYAQYHNIVYSIKVQFRRSLVVKDIHVDHLV